MQQFSPLPEALRRAASFERKRERERERERPPEALRELRERSGWDGGRKGTWDFGTKSTYLMQFSQISLFPGPDSVASRAKEPKTILPRERFAKHIKPQWPTLIFYTLY